MSGSRRHTNRPIRVREQKQKVLTVVIMLSLAGFMLTSGLRCLWDDAGLTLRTVAVTASIIMLLISFSSLLAREWTIGMLPPAGAALLVFLSSRYYDIIACDGFSPEKLILLTAIAVLCVLLLFFLAVSAAMLFFSFSPGPDENAVLLVLGCRIKDGKPSPMMQRRLKKAENCLRSSSGMRCILSGGTIADEPYSEAGVMLEWLTSHGISRDILFTEDRSTTTYENILFSRETAEANGLPMTFAVVSDRFHQLRVRLICRKYGITAIPVNAATPLYLLVQYWSREVMCLAEKWIKQL